MNDHFIFYRCKWCGVIFKDKISGNRFSDDANTVDVLGWSMDRKPLAIHYCDGTYKPGEEKRLGVAELIGSREVRK